MVYLLEKSLSPRDHQRKSSHIIIKQIPNKVPEETIPNLRGDLKRKPTPDMKDEEIDFIVLEESSQDAAEHSQEELLVENEHHETDLIIGTQARMCHFAEKRFNSLC